MYRSLRFLRSRRAMRALLPALFWLAVMCALSRRLLSVSTYPLTASSWSPLQGTRGVVGDSNSLSHAAANALALAPGWTDAEAEMRGLPPLYGRFTAAEDALPQHAVRVQAKSGGHDAKGDVEVAEGEVAPGVEALGNGYLWIANHGYGAGWGNALQELLLNAELAFRANRAFVFDNYTWDRDGPPYTLYGADEVAAKAGKLIPARVPLSAMIGGPLVGAPFPPSSSNSSSQPHPRAISRTHFQRVCPRPIVLDPAVIKAPLNSASLPDTITAWLVVLAPLGPCVQIARDGPQVFDIWLLGTAARVLPYWPALATSPILTAFRWAPLVRAALGDGFGPGNRGNGMNKANRRFFPRAGYVVKGNVGYLNEVDQSAGERGWEKGWWARLWWSTHEQQKAEQLPPVFDPVPVEDVNNGAGKHHSSSRASAGYNRAAGAGHRKSRHPEDAPLPGLLALHVRRGDFGEHCTTLAKWSAGFNALNSFAGLFKEGLWNASATGANHTKKARWRGQERFVIPEGGGWGETTPENLALYQSRCFPSIEQIVDRVREVRTDFEARTGRRLDWVYVLTNGKHGWLAELAGALKGEGAGAREKGADEGNASASADPTSVVNVTQVKVPWAREGSDGKDSRKAKPPNGAGDIHGANDSRTEIQAKSHNNTEDDILTPMRWESIATSRDLALTWEQRYVAQAVDMYIATRADVFIGNGFSSLTSNVVMFRMARGVDPQNTWFW